MLKDLWTASEKPAFEFPDRVSLRSVLDETVGRLAEPLKARNIQVQNQVPDSLPQLNVDKPKFHRLFELLLKDEIASLPPGSVIRFSAQLHNGGDKQQVRVQMTDNGPGMPKEALRLVFDPFVVRSDTPMEYGIHLMACFFIVHHHGGRIEARSGEGQGTTFTLSLPLDPSKTTNAAPEETEFFRKLLLSESLWEKLISSD
jgi:signal transduction histidine kinase